MPRDGQACRRGHRYVDTSFAVRGLRAGADYCFRVVTEGGASQPLTSAPRGPLEVSDVTRSSTTFSWLPQRRTAERRSWPTSSSSPEHPSPTWPHVARVRPQTTVYTVGNRVEWIDYQFRVCVENVEICQTDDPPDHFHGRRLVSPRTRVADDAGNSPFVRSFSVNARSDIFVSFRRRTFNESKPVTFTSLILMPPCLQRQEHFGQCVNSAECAYLFI